MKKAVWFLFGCSVISALPVFALCPSADLTGDCYVDLADLLTLTSQWLTESIPPAACPTADRTGDCHVDGEDFFLLSEQWLTGGGIPSDLVFIPPGTFQMGSSFGNSDESPVHTVTLNPFAMGKHEITYEKYSAFLKAAYPSQLKVVNGIVYASGDTANIFPYCDTSTSYSESQIAFSNNTFSVQTKGGRNMSKYPIVSVSWYGAVAYCNWRSQQEGKQLCYDLSTWECDFSKKGYRLPTEAEWEYAVRGQQPDKRFPWGDTITHNQANYYSSSSDSYDVSLTRGYHPTWNDGIYPYTSPVGSFPANDYGLYDMVGNVFEWCNDCYLDRYYSSSPQSNPTGPTTHWNWDRVCRGGSWISGAHLCRVSYRYSSAPNYRGSYRGFRLVLDF